MNLMTNDLYVILLAMGIATVIAGLIWLLKEPPKWSDWMPVMENGVSGFEHEHVEAGISDDMMSEDPHILIVARQFIPLTKFIGKGYKPVSEKKWQKLYAKKRPYKWHAGLGSD